MRILDLFCCQGGAAVGYHRAGFDVVGVDASPQPRYPYRFLQRDAIAYLEWFADSTLFTQEFDAIHASPPCHDHSTLKSMSGLDGTGYLLDRTRELLLHIGIPYVIENVLGAPMRDPIILCGSEFGLGATCRDGKWRHLRRHRQFESNFPIERKARCSHVGQAVGVYGTGGGGQMTRGYKAHPDEAREALGIDWMDRAGMSQAIPPAYTHHIGNQLASFLLAQTRQEAA